ncbi:MAG: GNAT family N-acetyltransferase [Candidatus Altiarchaeota archaeon]
MKKDDVDVRIVKRWPKGEIIRLYTAGGWWKGSDDPATVGRIISGSFAFAVAVDGSTGKAVGMGRVISDGVSDAYIQDVVVLPRRRGMQVGQDIIKALRDRCILKGIGWIGLVAEPGTGSFYSRLGFRPLKGHLAMRHMG